MYYYIFDLKKCKKRSIVEDIKNHLSILGISGEFAYPSAAYTTEELVKLALSKKYNTIIGIGDDEIANQIASVMCGRSEAMGLIPLEISPELSVLLGAKTWKEAADNLKIRKIEEIRIGKTASGGCFLTNLELDINTDTEVTIEFKDFIAQAKATKLLVSNFDPEIQKIGDDYLDVYIETHSEQKSGIFSKISSIFGSARETITSTSLIRARSLRLFTSNQITLSAGGSVIAKTPQLIESSDEKLRIITGKKNIN